MQNRPNQQYRSALRNNGRSFESRPGGGLQHSGGFGGGERGGGERGGGHGGGGRR